MMGWKIPGKFFFSFPPNYATLQDKRRACLFIALEYPKILPTIASIFNSLLGTAEGFDEENEL